MSELLFGEVTIPVTDRKMYFWEEDLWVVLSRLEEIPKVIKINSLFVDKEDRNKGKATQMLKEFCESHEDYVILIQAGVSDKEYAEEPEQEVVYEIVDKLTAFYEKRGFININENIGGYENSTFMVYNNQLAQDTLLKALNNPEGVI